MRYGRLILRAFGWRGLLRRAAYMARLSSGVLRRQLPPADDFSRAPIASWTHTFDLDAIRHNYADKGLDKLVEAQVVADADRVLSGQQQLYGDRWHDVGWPPRWHVNTFTGHEYPRVHWTEIVDDDPERGDIKDVWELSRLPFTFLLARAHVLTSDDRYVEAWWQAINDWATHNPPNLGVNWRCGQETSLRGIALCFGLSAFADHPASTPPRLKLAKRILGASVTRVQPTLGYALSQRNNHAVSELVFLLSVRTEGDRKLLRLLLEVLDDQFYPDGSYSQQSFTYQRLAVQALQWLLVTRPDLPPGARSRVVEVLARSRDFLTRCSDPVSGWLPNYGPTDGAMLLYLSIAHYRDFRPMLASLGQLSEPQHREPVLWLPLSEVAHRRTDATAQPTTYQTLRGPRSLAFMRVGTGRHRAAHSDQQALDLWIGGHNVVVDPGTFRYTALPPWQNALTGLEVHSAPHGPTDSVITLGRFLAEVPPDAHLVYRCAHSNGEVLVSKRPSGNGSLWRAVVRRDDAYAVVDAADGVEADVRWNLGDVAQVDIMWSTSQPGERGQPKADVPASGWSSALYGTRCQIDARTVVLRDGDVATTKFSQNGYQHLADDEVRNVLTGYPVGRSGERPTPHYGHGKPHTNGKTHGP